MTTIFFWIVGSVPYAVYSRLPDSVKDAYNYDYERRMKLRLEEKR